MVGWKHGSEINRDDSYLFIDESALHTSGSSPHRSYPPFARLGNSPSPFFNSSSRFFQFIDARRSPTVYPCVSFLMIVAPHNFTTFTTELQSCGQSVSRPDVRVQQEI